MNVGEWLTADVTPSSSGKTSVWSLYPRKDKPGDFEGEYAGALLGRVKWYGQWRKYAFFPEPGTLFEPDCLHSIAEFCADKTRRHRKKEPRP